MRLSSLLLSTALVLASWCLPQAAEAGDKYLPATSPNPAPSEPFSAFDRVELAPVQLAAPFDKHKANIAARETIQNHFNARMGAWLLAMNTREAKSEIPRQLLVEPIIVKIKFIGTGARIWAGAMAGSSQVLLRMKITDKQSGQVVAEPEFYQRANAWGGAYSSGATDRDMLARIVDLCAGYLSANLEAAVGGPTGAEGLK